MKESNVAVRNFAEQYKSAIESISSTRLEVIDPQAISGLFSRIEEEIENVMTFDFSKLTPENEAVAIAKLRSSLTKIIADAEDTLELKIDFGDLEVSGVDDLVKSFSSLSKVINDAKREHAQLRKVVNSEGQFGGYLRQLSVVLSTQQQLFPTLKSSSELKNSFENQSKILKNQLNLDLITYEQYYDELLKLELKHQDDLQKLEAENRRQKYEFLSSSIADLNSVFHYLIDLFKILFYKNTIFLLIFLCYPEYQLCHPELVSGSLYYITDAETSST